MVRVDWLEVAKGLGDRGDAAAAAACVGVGEVLQRDVAEAVAEDEVVGAEARVAELGADAGDVVPRGADEVDRLENREGGGRRVVRREGKFFFLFCWPHHHHPSIDALDGSFFFFKTDVFSSHTFRCAIFSPPRFQFSMASVR